MKPFEYYSKPKIPYGNKLDYITFYVYDRGEVIDQIAAFETSKRSLEGQYPNAVIQEVLDEDAFKAHLVRYSEDQQRLSQEFQDDLFDEFEVSDNPKRYKCFALAWENGHAHGHSEVYNHFGDYVELIKD